MTSFRDNQLADLLEQRQTPCRDEFDFWKLQKHNLSPLTSDACARREY
jgi:hypothetical protein